MDLISIAPVIAGALVSYGLEFIPKLSTWFHAATTRQRAAIVAALTALVVVLLTAGECSGVVSLGIGVQCDAGIGIAVRDALSAWLLALLGGQGAHLLLKREGA